MVRSQPEAMKLIVTGHARHGKDTVCEMIAKKTWTRFTSSSQFVAEKAVRPYLAAKGITYGTFDEMYADRVNHRANWFDAISAYNEPDAARLGRELFEEGNSIYCGLRNKRELDELRKQGLADAVIWVDASKRLPPEPETSMTITPKDCDIIIHNDGTLEELEKSVDALVRIVP